MRALAVCFAAMFVLSALVMFVPDTDADGSFTITDGKGNTVRFDAPVDHIITIGVGVTATVLQLGHGSKIVVADKSSAANSNELFDELRQRIADHKAVADGSIYSDTGIDDLKGNIVDAADREKGGEFDKSRDVIILTGGDTYLIGKGLIQYFKDLGFRVLAWNDMYEYDDIITFVSKMSMAVSGSVSSEVDRMKKVESTIESTLTMEGVTERREAFYLTYSSNVFKVGNKGSIATSLIVAAGGDAFTIDPSKSGTTYEANLTDLIEEHGTDVIIFADYANIASNPERLQQVRTMVGNDVKIVPLEPLWNNYSIESMNGVWTMACAMYPDYFSGDVPTVDGGGNNNVLVGAVIGTVAAVVILLWSAFYMKRR